MLEVHFLRDLKSFNSKIMKKHTILICLLISALFSCDNSIDYPLTYSSIPVTDKTTRLYAKNGEITDLNVINDFVNKYGNFYSDLESDLSKIDIVATYLNPRSVVISTQDSERPDTFNVVEQNGLIYWESRDTVERVYFFIDSMFLYKPLHYRIIDIPNRLSQFRGLDCAYVNRVGTNLSIPVSYFYYRLGGDINGYMTGGNFYNKFNPDYMSKLRSVDTILVYEYSIILEPK